ncbi:glycolate oxidase subunit GlcF [Zoogloea sp. LCSB751]|uniref:glycolate oxidase subunit GlcF n=1 Tax=Zoogloea sp. LCSB751 TaxID=1965277 RepID=UPI0009A4837C|nr:glycolate oxidase subunit GlcF [Zoogloea sp. LCSB751]
MQTNLSEAARHRHGADVAESVLRSCVHCGFCNATCPTYQLLGNELDGPRGRIYLMKQMFETGEVSESTRTHLDRCLTCRNCETTCPSGVQYHKLLDIGRAAVEELVPRSTGERLRNLALRAIVPNPERVKAALGVASTLRAFLPASVADKLPRHQYAPKPRPTARQSRVVLMLEGCVQPGVSPNTNAAAARILDRLGISVQPAPAAGCCGAVDYHLNAQEAGLDRARRNIDAWWPAIEDGAEAIVQTASGCGAFVKEYGFLLRDDPAYRDKAARVSALAKDLVEVLAREPLEKLGVQADKRLAFHCPCTLQHAQKLGGAVEGVLRRVGFALTAVPDGHLCCGSAGTYSITQPELSRQLRDRKMDALESGKPQLIATANIGCQMHLDGAGRTEVRHWIEIVEDTLPSQ